MSDKILEKILGRFDLKCIDKRRKQVFIDLVDTVFNSNVLEKPFLSHFQKKWVEKKEALLIDFLSGHFYPHPISLKRISYADQRSLIYFLESNQQHYVVKSRVYFDIPDAMLITHFLRKKIVGSHLNIPMPQAQLMFLDKNEIFILMKKSPGVSLKIFLQASAGRDSYRLALSNVAEKLSQVHAVTGKQFGCISLDSLIKANKLTSFYGTWYETIMLNFERHLSLCVEQFLINNKQSKEILSLFQAHQDLLQPSEPSLLHGDFSRNNVFMQAGTVSNIMDWEYAMLGDPLFELADLSWAYKASDFEILFQSYLQARELFLDEPMRMKFYLYRLRSYVGRTVLSRCLRPFSNSPLKKNKLLFLYQQTRDYFARR